MSALYFDASYLAKLRWQEPGAGEVRTRAAAADEIVSCIHGQAEFLLVGARKMRECSATQEDVRRVFAQFRADDRHFLAAAPLFGLLGVNVIV